MKIAVILNTNKLGGAERSLIEQLSILPNKTYYHFFYPRLYSSPNEIVNFLTSKGFTQIKDFSYPHFLYKLSRSGHGRNFLLIIKGPFLLVYLILWNRIFKEFSSFYLNGNKASFAILSWVLLFRRPVSIFWHFRDYPSAKAFSLLGRILKKLKRPSQRFILIGNSYAVANELKLFFPSFDIRTLYNLPGELPLLNPPEKIRIIGVVAMFAPWKGLHEVLLTIALYEKEFRGFGIEKFVFYGSGIYQTVGSHQNYHQDLLSLVHKFKINHMVEFAGIKQPAVLFSEIDLLIHPSLTPEPFGRVIIEAFKTHRPVISTGMGGAGELVQHEINGLVYSPYSGVELYKCIRRLAENNQLVKELTLKGFQKIQDLEIEVKEKISHMFPF